MNVYHHVGRCIDGVSMWYDVRDPIKGIVQFQKWFIEPIEDEQ